MLLKKGQVVRSLAGHDKGDFQTVLEVRGELLVLCDGKRRSLEKPKQKKVKHVAPTKTILDENKLVTNRAIRNALKQFNENAQ